MITCCHNSVGTGGCKATLDVGEVLNVAIRKHRDLYIITVNNKQTQETLNVKRTPKKEEYSCSLRGKHVCIELSGQCELVIMLRINTTVLDKRLSVPHDTVAGLCSESIFHTSSRSSTSSAMAHLVIDRSRNSQKLQPIKTDTRDWLDANVVNEYHCLVTKLSRLSAFLTH